MGLETDRQDIKKIAIEEHFLAGVFILIMTLLLYSQAKKQRSQKRLESWNKRARNKNKSPFETVLKRSPTIEEITKTNQ